MSGTDEFGTGGYGTGDVDRDRAESGPGAPVRDAASAGRGPGQVPGQGQVPGRQPGPGRPNPANPNQGPVNGAPWLAGGAVPYAEAMFGGVGQDGAQAPGQGAERGVPGRPQRPGVAPGQAGRRGPADPQQQAHAMAQQGGQLGAQAPGGPGYGDGYVPEGYVNGYGQRPGQGQGQPQPQVPGQGRGPGVPLQRFDASPYDSGFTEQAAPYEVPDPFQRSGHEQPGFEQSGPGQSGSGFEQQPFDGGPYEPPAPGQPAFDAPTAEFRPGPMFDEPTVRPGSPAAGGPIPPQGIAGAPNAQGATNGRSANSVFAPRQTSGNAGGANSNGNGNGNAAPPAGPPVGGTTQRPGMSGSGTWTAAPAPQQAAPTQQPTAQSGPAQQAPMPQPTQQSAAHSPQPAPLHQAQQSGAVPQPAQQPVAQSPQSSPLHQSQQSATAQAAPSVSAIPRVPSSPQAAAQQQPVAAEAAPVNAGPLRTEPQRRADSGYGGAPIPPRPPLPDEPMPGPPPLPTRPPRAERQAQQQAQQAQAVQQAAAPSAPPPQPSPLRSSPPDLSPLQQSQQSAAAQPAAAPPETLTPPRRGVTQSQQVQPPAQPPQAAHPPSSPQQAGQNQPVQGQNVQDQSANDLSSERLRSVAPSVPGPRAAQLEPVADSELDDGGDELIVPWQAPAASGVEQAPVEAASHPAPVENAAGRSASPQNAVPQSPAAQTAPAQNAPVQAGQAQNAPIRNAQAQNAPVQAAQPQAAPVRAQAAAGSAQQVPVQQVTAQQAAPAQADQTSASAAAATPPVAQPTAAAQSVAVASGAAAPAQAPVAAASGASVPAPRGTRRRVAEPVSAAGSPPAPAAAASAPAAAAAASAAAPARATVAASATASRPVATARRVSAAAEQPAARAADVQQRSYQRPEQGDPAASGLDAGGRAPAYEDEALAAVYRVIHERRDVRNDFLPDEVPTETLTRILDAAHTAPSVGFSQPWDFLVIRDEAMRQSVHELAVRQRRAYAASLPKARARAFAAIKTEAILDTPVNIVVTCDPTRGGRHTLGRQTQPLMAPFSSCLAVENLWLAARAEGLGVGWVSFFDERELAAVLDLPDHLQVVAYLCVGYVKSFPTEPELAGAGWAKRRPLAWAVHEERFGHRALPGAEPISLLNETVDAIRGLDPDALAAARERQARMTKPPGSLGALEAVSEQLAGLAGVCPPPLPEPAALAVFAGDHGVHAQGVTPWPQEVTAQMVANFLAGGAVVNAFAKQVGAEVCVVDVGVNADLKTTSGLIPRKIRYGTGDMTEGPALTRDEAIEALEAGIETARDLVAAGNRCLLTGDMGIANTTASAALIAAFTGASPAQVTGYGTGIDEQTYAHKVEVVGRALALHRPDPQDPVGVLAAFGGLEHAALAGFILGAAALRIPVVLDGVIAGAAALVAQALSPEVTAACVAGHRSAEPGHALALEALGITPLIDLELRLGEGSGAALALPLVGAAVRALREVATFDDAGVADASDAVVVPPTERERT